MDDSDEGLAAIDRPWSSQPLPKSSSRTSSLTSGGLQSSGMDIPDRLAAPSTSPDWLLIIPITPDMLRSDMEDELDRSGHVWELLILGQDSELTILTNVFATVEVS